MAENNTTSLQHVAQVVEMAARPHGAGYSREQLELIKRTVCRDATDDELALFMSQARRMGLDPFSRQIHSVRRWDSDLNGWARSTQIGIDGFRLIADRSGLYMPGPRPAFTYDKFGDVISCISFVLKWSQHDQRWHVVEGEAYYEEYVQKRRDGKPMRNWATMPRVMLAKVAEVIALRRAFPAELGSVYVSEELPPAPEQDEDAQPQPTRRAPPPPHARKAVPKAAPAATDHAPAATSEAAPAPQGAPADFDAPCRKCGRPADQHGGPEIDDDCLMEPAAANGAPKAAPKPDRRQPEPDSPPAEAKTKVDEIRRAIDEKAGQSAPQPAVQREPGADDEEPARRPIDDVVDRMRAAKTEAELAAAGELVTPLVEAGNATKAERQYAGDAYKKELKRLRTGPTLL